MEELRWSSLLGRLTPRLRLHNTQETSSGFALYPYGFWNGEVSLHLAYFDRRQVFEVTSEGF